MVTITYRDPALKVLIADDDPAAANALGALMEHAGNAVTVVYDGRAAVAAALADPPDVVLLDIGLPGLDGWSAARRIRAGLAGHACLIIAVTGFGEVVDRIASRRAGIDLHLTKPVSLDKLDAMLAHYHVPA